MTPQSEVKWKLVKVEMQIEMLVSVPSTYTDEDIEFFLNESSHCSMNEIEQFWKECNNTSEGCCNSCARTNFKVLDMEPSKREIENYIENYGDPNARN